MTWVLGSAMVFGYGALISDIRVTWRDGRPPRDILQKIYPIGPMMMAGFSGSVKIGFTMIADLQACFGRGPIYLWEGTTIWYPERACWRWYRRGRWLFKMWAPDEQQLGCQLIIAAASPFPNGAGGNLPRCIRMVAPLFVPERIVGHWTSIGSGAGHRSAAWYAQQFLTESGFQLLQGERMHLFGAAEMTAQTVAMALQRQPMADVSDVLQVGVVTAQGCQIRGIESIPAGTSSKAPARLAQSWEEYEELCGREGAEAGQAGSVDPSDPEG